MTRICYVIFCFFGVIIFIFGVNCALDGDYGTAAIIGSFGIFIAICLFDASKKMYDETNAEDDIINEAKKYLEENYQIYNEALLKIESFKRKGINTRYQTYDVYERNEYEKACSIIYDYEQKKKIIDDIKTKRIIKDAKTLTAMIGGFIIGKKLSEMSRKNK